MTLVKLVKAKEVDLQSPTPEADVVGFVDADYV